MKSTDHRCLSYKFKKYMDWINEYKILHREFIIYYLENLICPGKLIVIYYIHVCDVCLYACVHEYVCMHM